MRSSGESKKQAIQLRFRAATMADARFLFRLRNDPTTRASSSPPARSRSPITARGSRLVSPILAVAFVSSSRG